MEVAEIVAEVTDTKWLEKKSRKRLQISKAAKASSGAKLVKLADKICNLRDIIASPPDGWSLERKREYFDWAKKVALEAEAELSRARQAFNQQIAQQQAAPLPHAQETVAQVRRDAQQASRYIRLSEEEPRILIDSQLRERGWEVDTQLLDYRRGAHRSPH